jgi:uncharacterized repeat protein (TIGR02543 family)
VSEGFAEDDATVVFSASPAGGFRVKEWHDGAGATAGPATTFTLTNVTEPTAVTVAFEQFFTVSFNLNGGTSTAIDPVAVAAGGTLGASFPAPPTRPSHTFVGWFDTAATSGGNEFEANTPITGNVTLSARWDASV